MRQAILVYLNILLLKTFGGKYTMVRHKVANNSAHYSQAKYPVSGIDSYVFESFAFKHGPCSDDGQNGENTKQGSVKCTMSECMEVILTLVKYSSHMAIECR